MQPTNTKIMNEIDNKTVEITLCLPEKTYNELMFLSDGKSMDQGIIKLCGNKVWDIFESFYMTSFGEYEYFNRHPFELADHYYDKSDKLFELVNDTVKDWDEDDKEFYSGLIIEMKNDIENNKLKNEKKQR